VLHGWNIGLQIQICLCVCVCVCVCTQGQYIRCAQSYKSTWQKTAVQRHLHSYQLTHNGKNINMPICCDIHSIKAFREITGSWKLNWRWRTKFRPRKRVVCGQDVARDTVVCCSHSYQHWEKVFLPFPRNVESERRCDFENSRAVYLRPCTWHYECVS